MAYLLKDQNAYDSVLLLPKIKMIPFCTLCKPCSLLISSHLEVPIFFCLLSAFLLMFSEQCQKNSYLKVQCLNKQLYLIICRSIQEYQRL